MDFGRCLSKKPSEEAEKFHLLTEHWVPPKKFQFPVSRLNNKNRKFQADWLEKHPWLVYSPSLDGVLCKHCVMFANDENLGYFVKSAYRNWNKCSDDLKNHATKKYHADAMLKSENFLENMRNPVEGIDVGLNAEAEAQIAINRKILASIFKTVFLCGQQGLALRGHRDDGVLEEGNRSNFNALLKFRIDSGDNFLQNHLQTCDSNATYISKETQNRMIDILGDQIRGRLLAEIRSATYFAVLADEVTDASNMEQISIVIRFVDSSNVIQEAFLSFVECDNITGETLAGLILQSLRNWDLDAANIRGQGYDGAANMAGKFKGVQARILEINEKALYFHCAAHCLNLCIVKACSVPAVKNMLAVLKQLSLFFSQSPKRQRKFEEVIGQAATENKRQKLVDLCRTRWVERHHAFETFAAMSQVVFDCLGQITQEDNWDADTACKAQGLLHAISDSGFLIAFVVTRRCLQYLQPLSVKLQKRARDIVDAYSAITNITASIQELRTNVDDVFSASWFLEATEMAQNFDTTIQVPRLNARQLLRENHPADTAMDYFRTSVAVPFLDYLVTQMNDRFKNAELAQDALQLIPENLVRLPGPFLAVPDGVKHLALLWDTDLPDSEGLAAELHRWSTKWRNFNQPQDIPSTIESSLKACDMDMYPNIHMMLKLICTLPITTAECERTISGLRSLKTYTRTSMGAGRLNGLALMRIHRDIPIDIKEAVDSYATKYRSYMQLLPKNFL